MTSRPVALAYRLAAVTLMTFGLMRLVGVFQGALWMGAFLYYTTLSNVLCIVWMALMAAVTAKDLRRDGPRGFSAPAPRMEAAVVMAITVTMLIYLVILVPTLYVQGSGDYKPFGLTDDLVHIITPCLLLFDWLVFNPHGRLRAYDPALWTALPYAYLAFAFTWGALGGTFGDGSHYPYFFMDVQEHSLGGVALWIAGLTCALVAFGYIYLAADKVMARITRSGAAPGLPGGSEAA